MPSELRRWQCGRCGYVVDLPDHETEHDQFIAAMNRIREHRFAHIATAFEDGSDAHLDRLCEDEPTGTPGTPLTLDNLLRARDSIRVPGTVTSHQTEPVSQEDVDHCIPTVMELLRDDLPRARQLWYPINEDGGFNR